MTLGNALTSKVVEAIGFMCTHHTVDKKRREKRRSNVNAFSINVNGTMIPLYCSWVSMMHYVANSLLFRW